MNNTSPIQLELAISASDATTDEIDQMTRQLLSELRDFNVESVELVKSDSVPEGTKTVDPVTVGALAIAVLPTFLPKILEFIQAWALRGQGRTVKFKGKIANQKIEFEGSPDDLQKIVKMLAEAKK